MDDVLMLEAPPTMFEALPAILELTGGSVSTLTHDSVTRGIRRLDTASYRLTLGDESLELWVDRRLGNRTMNVSIFPKQKLVGQEHRSSDALACRLIDILVTHGASTEASSKRNS